MRSVCGGVLIGIAVLAGPVASSGGGRGKGEVERLLERGGLFFDIGAYHESAAEYQRALILAPSRAPEILPRLVRAYLEEGNAYFVQHRYPDAAVCFHRALRLWERGLKGDTGGVARLATYPSKRRMYEVRKRWAYALLAPVIQRINSGRMSTVEEWRQAEEMARKVSEMVPGVPHPHFVLGLCAEALGDSAGALAAYARITGEEPPPVATAEDVRRARLRAYRLLRKDAVRVMVATKDRRWLLVEPGGWQTITTEHFVILHRNRFVARKVARAAEYWYNAIVVHWTTPGTYRPWPRKCSIYLYPTREDFHKATGQPEWVPSVSYLLVQNGRLRDLRISTYQTVRLLNESVLPHEITHVVFPQLVGYPERFPRWIQECTALLEEPTYKRYRFRRAMRDYLRAEVALDMERLMSIEGHPPKEEARLFYAQCHAIAEFLMSRGGRRRFLRFAREVVKKGQIPALLETYGFGSLAEFDRAWRRYTLERQP